MTVRTIPANQAEHEAKFLRFHDEHPEVYTELVTIARRLKMQGWPQFAIATVFEVARYRSMVGNRSGNGPKLNNNHRAYYARLILRQEPDLAGVFKTRKLGVPGHLEP